MAVTSSMAARLQSLTWSHLIVCVLAAVYMTASAGMITFNKWLMREDRFPYSLCLGFLHMACCSSCCLTLLLVRPTLFPALTAPQSTLKVDRRLVLFGALPIAVFFAASICLSNSAYMFCSVALLQMLKEANVVIIYSLSLLAALERFSWQNLGILGGIVAATTLTVTGELHFVPVGLVIQLAAMLFECTRIVLQALLLSPNGHKLDPLSYCCLVTPVCLCVIGVSLVALSHLTPGVRSLQIPPAHVFGEFWAHLLANSLLAFALNVITAMFLKYSSAMTVMLTGILKDVTIVLAGCVFLHESITSQQAAGFVLQLALMGAWSYRKMMASSSPAPLQQRSASLAVATVRCESTPLLDEQNSPKDDQNKAEGTEDSTSVGSEGSNASDMEEDARAEAETLLQGAGGAPR